MTEVLICSLSLLVSTEISGKLALRPDEIIIQTRERTLKHKDIKFNPSAQTSLASDILFMCMRESKL